MFMVGKKREKIEKKMDNKIDFENDVKTAR